MTFNKKIKKYAGHSIKASTKARQTCSVSIGATISIGLAS